MDKLFNILGRESGLKAVLCEVNTGNTIRENWEMVFGDLASEIGFSMVKKDVLYADVKNPLWVTELRFYKGTILGKLNALFSGKETIRDIVVRTATNM